MMSYPNASRYDVLQVDWRKGQGWQDYTTLREADEFSEAVRIVRGGDCFSMPHWIARADVAFRVVDAGKQTVKIAE